MRAGKKLACGFAILRILSILDRMLRGGIVAQPSNLHKTTCRAQVAGP
jgi:hypothetical protein